MNPPADGTPEKSPTPAPADESPTPTRPSQIDREKLDQIFGVVLPEVTSDERDDSAASGRGLDWYRENRPPHHG